MQAVLYKIRVEGLGEFGTLKPNNPGGVGESVSWSDSVVPGVYKFVTSHVSTMFLLL